MGENKDYNGWKNYETWVFNLWIDNEEPTYNYWRKVAAANWATAEPTKILTRRQNAKYHLAADLKHWAEEQAPNLRASVWADLMAAAMSEVDWDEIAESMLAEHFETDENGKRISDKA